MLQTRADYEDEKCLESVEFDPTGSPGAITSKMEEYGFVVLDTSGDASPEEKLLAVAAALGLGDPYVPVLYRRSETNSYGSTYSDIQSNPADHHPGFSTTAGQDWHVDGLLDEIGAIKVTTLYCVRDAEEGGETLLFNSLAAFEELRETDRAAAAALMEPTVLTRTSTIPGTTLSATGPVFAQGEDGDLETRYTDNETCTWDHSVGTGTELAAALAFMRAAADNPKYTTAVRLAPGQALVFRNDRVSHGRRAYVDRPESRRHLIRALYASAPVRSSAR